MSRARLDGSALRDVEQIFAVSQTKSGGQHFGSRIAWMNDGTMLLAIGDGGNPPVRLDGELIRNRAQDKNAHFGKILRLNADGTPAAGNPFATEEGIAASVYSYGHRNIQGLAIDSATGAVWATEHGARGGDELNRITPAANYGWPTVTYSREYAGPRISDATSQEGMTDPAVVWTPAIAPSGLTIYTGDRFPDWKGDLFAGGLVTSEVRRIDLDGDRVVGETTMRFDARVRDVRTGPDGYLYVLTDEPQGRLLRILPQ
jgi:glucose/arabinose dehydrogenase